MIRAVPHNAVRARSDDILKGMVRLLEDIGVPQPELAPYSVMDQAWTRSPTTRRRRSFSHSHAARTPSSTRARADRPQDEPADRGRPATSDAA
jgi:hypothetical protein